MSTVPSQVAETVEIRANFRCEYCCMHQLLQGATFHVDHIIPSTAGSSFRLQNLAWCCPSCNQRKSNHTSALDPETNESVPLFNPRSDSWEHSFEWNSYEIRDHTPTGRATISLLKLNTLRRILIRKAEETFDLFPPPISDS